LSPAVAERGATSVVLAAYTAALMTTLLLNRTSYHVLVAKVRCSMTQLVVLSSTQVVIFVRLQCCCAMRCFKLELLAQYYAHAITCT
jgi:hypothetical protein